MTIYKNKVAPAKGRSNFILCFYPNEKDEIKQQLQGYPFSSIAELASLEINRHR
jgi:hypothetical protein